MIFFYPEKNWIFSGHPKTKKKHVTKFSTVIPEWPLINHLDQEIPLSLIFFGNNKGQSKQARTMLNQPNQNFQCYRWILINKQTNKQSNLSNLTANQIKIKIKTKQTKHIHSQRTKQTNIVKLWLKKKS